MHILFLTDNFPPEVNAPASRTFEHCREWVKAGHKITVITCAPNFPKGRLFEGYKNSFYQTEEVDGIRVIRVWSYITANEGFVKRILDYQSFMVTATLASPFVRGVDLVVGTSPQFFTVCAAYVVSRMKRVPFVFELRDLWPESIRAVGAMKDSRLLDWLEKLELFLYRKASAIVSVTNAFRDNIIARGADIKKIHVVTNGVDISRFKPREKDVALVRKLGIEGKFVSGYIGTHGMAHSLETLLDAAAKIKTMPDGKRHCIIFLGDGARKADLKTKAESMSLDNVIFVDSVSKDEVVKYWSLLDVSIIHLSKTDLFTTVIPSKLFECMGMGIPVLHGVAGESAGIVQKEGVGIVFEPENANQLCHGLMALSENKALYDKYRANAMVGARNYDRSVLAGKMLDVLEVVAKGH
ncbi:glycosyltransferase family 4 protein [Nitrosomonas mobilis]|uniref:Group 1 glycosyl transferase n=1 Tax=Nitrosomonas mobilis TaxID=51642 RepID=A0A1G5SDR6_9PROT|nr:glycosyltransferase family 4 protein [Nitrosomonas mobilis]SCZ85248.1 Group 1 glycosyl transferase [Nitrosomonas mobilis]